MKKIVHLSYFNFQCLILSEFHTCLLIVTWNSNRKRWFHLEDDGHVEVAEGEADALEVDDADVRAGDDREGHLDQLHQAVDRGHDEAWPRFLFLVILH